ncbi:MAG: hypothetical protein HQK97_08310 [Nitrospirae bacterium]|nr:hypothetical protein [Nitrospirota bacterium]
MIETLTTPENSMKKVVKGAQTSPINVRNTVKKAGGRPRKGHEKPKPKADFNTLELLKSMLNKAKERGDSKLAARLETDYNWFMGQYCKFLMRKANEMFKKKRRPA